MKTRTSNSLKATILPPFVKVMGGFNGYSSPRGAFRMSHVGAACLALMAASQVSFAAQLSLSQVPAGNGSSEPAPNVILTVDDSGSMDWDVTTGSTTITTGKKIDLLKDALKTTFGDGTSNSGIIPDGRIRLAWQAMHDNNSSISSNGAKSIKLGAKNSIKPFVGGGTGSHRANFNAFVNSLTASNGTPSHQMMKNVITYLNAPANKDNPWATNPGSTTQAYLGCRRAYHIFMTDGAWNSQGTIRPSNGDSNSQTLGDGTAYNPTANTSKVFADNYGNNTSKASTLADLAFSGWARDLQNGAAGTTQTNSAGSSISGNTANIPNGIRPLIKKIGNETFSTTTCGSSCIVTPEYWNPKNNPSTWQGVTQFTIGFGTGAVNWPYQKVSNAPETLTTPLFTTTTASHINARVTAADWDYNNNSTSTTASEKNYLGDFSRLVQGELTWPDVYPGTTSTSTLSANQEDVRTAELWHAALNGRGKFFPAKSAQALNDAFDQILNTVLQDTSTPLVSIATSSSFLRTGLNAYIAGYNALKYSGSLSARPLDATTGAIGASEVWNAATQLDAITTANLANRTVISYSGTAGIAWKTYTSLPTAQKTKLNQNSSGTADSNGQNRVDYIRGDKTKELTTTNTSGIFRERDSRLGDIVNSNIWYTGKPASGYTENGYATFRGTGTGGKGGRDPMVYIGANDGMLHGFSATTGAEKIAYIPQGIAEGGLRKLTDTGYTHQYFVDGSPFAGDAYIGSTPSWKTVLTGTLGAGGKGYFVLDVTDPSTFSESNAASLVIFDTTATTDGDIGHIMSPPVVDDAIANKSRQVVKMNGGRWAVVLGNGVNSTNEAPVLLVQYLDGDKSIKKITPCAQPTSGACTYKGTNGLGAPALIDLNGDGTVDIAYAGDLKGNVWKFDLTSATDSAWKVSFSDTTNPLGRPFFIAKQGAQSFTAAPFWMAHPMGGVMVAIGTGQNLTDADQSDTTSTQTLYALWDNSTFTSTLSAVTMTDATPVNVAADTGVPTTLVQQTLTSTQVDSDGTNYFTSSSNGVAYSTQSTTDRGWYLNWTLAGERVLQNIRGFSGQKIMIQSMIPKTGSSSGGGETCSPSATTERNFQTVLNMFNGTPPKTPVFAFVDTSMSNTNTTKIEGKAGDTTLINNSDGSKIKLISSNCAVGQECAAKDFFPGAFVGARANWRVIQ
ncbi:MAG: hypothetical protein IPN06_03030 [Burkholderiales bacterium]|nr:hypothetical protein [Burkholderiales bacterium]